MNNAVEIVDRGRGPQLSTSRITVQDLVRYFQRGASYEEMSRWMPTLTREEIAALERYYAEHRQEFDEKERLAKDRREEQIRLQRMRFPELTGTTEEHLARFKKLLEQRLSRQQQSAYL